ncbi:PAS domain S-box protein [Dyadobacter tibetensis]|uniref:PAS domain S-box protein n=1 Tax=Dyadobacter tibetensis TaxID=1211851 RepID=UPI00046EEF43|nr:PAS domain S-box protein [Dyadobacter tibetensis]
MDRDSFWESTVEFLPSSLFSNIEYLLSNNFQGLPVQIALHKGGSNFRFFTSHWPEMAAVLFQQIKQAPKKQHFPHKTDQEPVARCSEKGFAYWGLFDEDDYLLGLIYVKLPDDNSFTDAQTQNILPLLRLTSQLLQQQKSLHIGQIEGRQAQQRSIQLFNIIEASNMGTWEWNVVTGELVINEQWANMLGYSAEELKPFTLDTWYNVLHPEDRAYSDEKLFACAHDEIDFYDIECRMIHKDGSIIWINDRGSVVSRSTEGAPVWLAGTHTDITEKHEANLRERALINELADRNEMIERILNQLPIGIAVYDNCQFRSSMVNDRYSQYFGWPREEINDMATFLEKLYPDPSYRQKVLDMVRKSIDSGDPGQMHWENLEITTRSGARRFINTSNIPLPGSNLTINTVLDVTQQYLQEIEIRRVKSNQEALINASDDLIWSLDLTGRIQACNKAFTRTIESLTNLKILEGDSVYMPGIAPEIFHKWREYYRRCASGQSFKVVEQTLDPIRNLTLYYSVSFQPIFEVSGKVRAMACYAKDITSERKHQEQIIRTRDELDKIMHMSLDIICTIDIRGHFTKVSAASEKTWGYHPSELVGRRYLDFILEADVEKTVAIEKILLRGEPITYFENRFKKKDGRICLLAWSVVWNAQDELNYCVARDITERKYAEDKLKHSEQYFKALVQDGSDLIAILEPNADYRYVSPSAIRVLGIEPEFFINKNALEFIHPEDQAIVSQSLAQVATSRTVSIAAFRFKTFPNEWRWIETVLTNLLDDPAVEGLVANSRDVTERIEAEKALQESIERFEKVAQATNDAIWDWDIEHDSMYWGGGFKHLFGYDGQQHPKTIEGCHRQIHSEDKKGMTQAFYTAIQDKKQNKFQYEYRFQKSDGSYALVIDRGVIIRDENRQAKRMVGAITDISYRKEFEEALQRLNSNLRQYTKELERSNAELEQFAYVASHDLQEPLRMVTSFLSLLQKKYEGKLDERAQQYIHFAVDGATRMRQIILDLLEYSRAGRKDTEPEWVDLNEILEDYRMLRGKSLREKSGTVCSDDLPRIMTFKGPLKQILYNLIDNGLKYSKIDQPPIVNVTFHEDDTFWKFSVNDNGIGIPEEYFSRIFELFQRLHPNSEYNGTGIGLAIVKKIIDNLNGKIWIESLVNHGSTFYFTIPKS